MKEIIKKYWRAYLEHLWYLTLLYWFVVFMDWYTGLGLFVFRPFTILFYMMVAGGFVWVKTKEKSN